MVRFLFYGNRVQLVIFIQTQQKASFTIKTSLFTKNTLLKM